MELKFDIFVLYAGKILKNLYICDIVLEKDIRLKLLDRIGKLEQ